MATIDGPGGPSIPPRTVRGIAHGGGGGGGGGGGDVHSMTVLPLPVGSL